MQNVDKYVLCFNISTQHSVLHHCEHHVNVEFYLYPTVGTVLIHSVKPELTE